MSSEPKEDKATVDPREAVDRSCCGPVLFLAFSAVAWLLVYSLFALLAGVKVHASGMMADSAWLTYGRIQPASQLALQFGFLLQLLPLPLQRLSAVATVLFLKQLVLQWVVAQKAGEALIQLPLQLLQPTHA